MFQIYQLRFLTYFRIFSSNLTNSTFKNDISNSDSGKIFAKLPKTVLRQKNSAAGFNGSFTLAMFVSETVSDSDIRLYLPWPPWVTRHREDHFYLGHVAQGDQGKYNACRCRWHFHLKMLLTEIRLKLQIRCLVSFGSTSSCLML